MADVGYKSYSPPQASYGVCNVWIVEKIDSIIRASQFLV